MDLLKKMSIDIKNIINDHINTTNSLLNDIDSIKEICFLAFETIKNGKTILLCGNGGSASDSIHIAAELVGRFEEDRTPLPAIALTANPANLTAIGNDYGFEYIFSRQVEAIGKEGDAFIGLSTSGNSKNVINGINKANSMGITTIGLTGQDGGLMQGTNCKLLKVASKNTARIQEVHILVGHIICSYIEKNKFQ